jgi:hypothetical protein
MGYGSLVGNPEGSQPSYVDAYNLTTFNIVTPGLIKSSAEGISINSHLDIYKVTNTVKPDQYFLLQQRKFGASDSCDQGMFKEFSSSANAATGGILIYHIDMSVPMDDIFVNYKNTHFRAGIEEAHGYPFHLEQVNYNMGGLDDLWGITKHQFSGTTNPSSGLYSAFTTDMIPPDQNTESGISINDIQWNGGLGTTTLNVSLPESANTYTINVSAGVGGSVGGGGIYEEGASVAVTATASPGYKFEGWYENSVKKSGDLTYEFTASSDMNLEAKFVVKSLYGDFTGNGIVDAVDVLWIQRYIACERNLTNMLDKYLTTIKTFQPLMGDFTNNGTVDGTDILWMQRYIVSDRNVEKMLNTYFTTINFNHLSTNGQ